MMFRILLIPLLAISFFSHSQDEIKRAIYYGNEAYVGGDFEEALEYYQQAVDQSPLNYKANYNLANTLFRLNQQEKAIESYTKIVNLAPSSYDRASVYHNMGNAHLMNQDLDAAIESYKNALRLNPSDEETRYNLAYAQQQKQQQQQQNQNQNQQNQDQQEGQEGKQGDNEQQNQQQNQSQDQEGQQNEDEDASQKDEQPEDQQQGEDSSQGNSADQEKDEQKGEGQEYGSKLSKEQIENILNAYYKREKELQKKLNEKKKIANGGSNQKDW
ncbi:MAG: tetratricopeptide repeat protein [Crocinitomicaceae bacterium]